MKADFDQIKATTDIVRIIESYGVVLKKSGHDHIGLCPFHEDTSPSLHVTPGKGLFHCPACGAAGNVIQFVAKKEGITDREAALKLLGQVPGVARASTLPAPCHPPPAVRHLRTRWRTANSSARSSNTTTSACSDGANAVSNTCSGADSATWKCSRTSTSATATAG